LRTCRGFYTRGIMPTRSANAGDALPPQAVASVPDPVLLAARIRTLARDAGFQRCGITGIDLGADEGHLRDWLARGFHGSMDWMARHGDKRSRPQELVAGTHSVLSVGLDHGPPDCS